MSTYIDNLTGQEYDLGRTRFRHWVSDDTGRRHYALTRSGAIRKARRRILKDS